VSELGQGARQHDVSEEAQENNITGDVLISFVVDPQGLTDEVEVGGPLLDRAAFNAVKRFNCISQGQPVRVQVPFSFNLN
jgi:protein TonB